jgi:hypothetical protein
LHPLQAPSQGAGKLLHRQPNFRAVCYINP